MLTVKLPTREVSITFRHPTYNISPHGYTESFQRQSTRAYVYEKLAETPEAQGKLLGLGIIKHYFKDPGRPMEWRRKEALKRALKESGLSKDERQMIWSALLNRKPTPETPVPTAVSAVIPFPIKVTPNVVEVVSRMVAEAKVGEHGAH